MESSQKTGLGVSEHKPKKKSSIGMNFAKFIYIHLHFATRRCSVTNADLICLYLLHRSGSGVSGPFSGFACILHNFCLFQSVCMPTIWILETCKDGYRLQKRPCICIMTRRSDLVPGARPAYAIVWICKSKCAQSTFQSEADAQIFIAAVSTMERLYEPNAVCWPISLRDCHFS